MDNMDKARFLKVYSNLPLNIRNDIILVLPAPHGPITWNVAYVEINNETELGKDIYTKLVELGLI